MEEKIRVKRPHRLNMEDRKRIDFTGITDVVSFDPVKVVLCLLYTSPSPRDTR